jgi:23S rRNA (uracil1939-C5)-methyltransferase
MQKRFVTAAIIKIGAQGDGLATHHSTPVYVAKTAPGDMVNFALGKPRAEGYSAVLQKIIKPSQHRVPPPCPYFDKCGGCALQHVNDKFYQQWKTNKLLHALIREDIEPEIVGDPVFLPHSTRRRTTVAAHKTGMRIGMGYFEARSQNIVDAEVCLILEPELEAKIQALRPYLPRLLPEDETCDITLQHIDGVFDMVLTGRYQHRGKFSFEQDEAIGEIAEQLDIARISFRPKDFQPPEIILNRKSVLKKFGAITVAVPSGAFLQASQVGEDALVHLVLGHTKDSKKVLDLFSGCGTFSGNMLQQDARVIAVDGDKDAINALSAVKYPKLTALRRDLFKDPVPPNELDAFDTVVMDPPRAGAKEQAEQLAQSQVKKIVSISCNPGTFARDAAILQKGGYRLRHVTLVDQFVWSAHLEIVGLFTR